MLKFSTILLLTPFLSPLSYAASTPEALLPNGVDAAIITNPYTGESGMARKGTVGATLDNIHTLNHLLNNTPSNENTQKIQAIMKVQAALIPSLKIIGLFDFFNASEWLMHAKEQPGRCLIGLIYLQKNPEKMTPEVKKILNQLKTKSQNDYLQIQLKKMI